MSCDSANTNSISNELKYFLEYVAGRGSHSNLTERLEKAVRNARLMKSWRKEYMLLDEIHDEGREEGRIEGREEGRIEGRA